jgi:formate C-acetyltransferase
MTTRTRPPAALPPQLAALRDAALRRTAYAGVPTLPLLDAAAWRQRTAEEDWLIWRARRTAHRLRNMPIDLSPGELIVGRPLLRAPTPEESSQIAEVRGVLESIPPFPGGDSAHFHPDYDKLFRLGLGGILEEINLLREAAGAEADKRAFYDACGLAVQGMRDYVLRVAEACDQAAGTASASGELAALCRRIAAHPPATFHEAIQLMFLTLVALWFGEDHAMTTPGRMDQTLRPFYQADLAAGRITRQRAFELICSLYIQLNMIAPPGIAVSVMVGGRDPAGQDVTSDLTYLCLEARAATRLVYPTVGLAWHEGTPPELTDFACCLLATGLGDPAFFNDELIASGLRDHGVSQADSCNYMNSTCVEIKLVGASNIWVTAPYFNCPQALLDTIEEIARGRSPQPPDFPRFCRLVKDRLARKVTQAAQELDRVWQQRSQRGCFPLASCFTRDCLQRAKDFDRGGARYNWVENSFVGLANLVDGLLAVKALIFDSQELSLPDFWQILEADYQGHEPLRLRILNHLPSYGADDDRADSLAVEFADFLQETTESNQVGGHRYVPGFFCWIMHGELGSRTGATPDGRRSGLALADGAGAAQGRETAGPTASLLSTTKWSHRRALGGLVQNLKLTGPTLSTARGLSALRGLIETYLRRGGFEIQVNVVNAQTLRQAQAHPEEYPDLLVRVAGYSDYFTHLSPTLQEEIIARSEHDQAGPHGM